MPCCGVCFAVVLLKYTKVEMQEEQIRQLEHHARKLKESLKAGGLVDPSVHSGVDSVNANANADAGEGRERGQTGQLSGGRGADGDLP